MRINHKILSIPPYISTSWKNVASLHVEQQMMGAPFLVVVLLNGQRIEIPHLETPVLEGIFHAHARYMEQEFAKPAPKENMGQLMPEQLMNFPLKIAIGGLEGVGKILEHNPQQTDAPPLPPEILQKIALLCRSLNPEETNSLPEAEPHCNCVHCQIARAFHEGLEHAKNQQIPEEEVTEADLKFRTWDITQTSDKLFLVSNPLNNEEHYHVFLGDPVGCTCGQKACEHIQAVLRS